MTIRRMSCIVALLFWFALASTTEGQSVGSPAWVTATVATLNSGSPSAQQVARKQLIQAAEMKSAPSSYPASFAAAILPVLQGGNARAKLNAAIALERIANKTASPSLVPAIDALLDDRCDAVAMWGVKSAMPLIASGDASSPLLAEHVAKAVKAHANSDPIAEEAYAALLPDHVQPQVVDALLAMLEIRTAAYGAGGMPPNPLAERSVLVFLVATHWPKASPGQQKRILTDLGNLECAVAGSLVNGNNDRAMLGLFHSNAVALETIGNLLGNAALTAAAQSLQSVRSGDDPALPAACKALQAAVAPLGIALQPLPPAAAPSGH